MQITPDAQVDIFRLILEMENRGESMDELYAQLKQALVQDAGEVSLSRAGSALRELRGHAEAIEKQLTTLEKSIGVQPRSSSNKRSAAPAVRTNQLRGTTSTIRIPDLLSLLSAQRKTGTLRLKTRSDERFVLEMLDGEVVHAATNKHVPDQLLGNILVAQNKISATKLQEFLEQFCPKSARIGTALAKSEMVSEQDLLEAIAEQVRAITRRLFAIDEAVFCFTDGPVSNIELRVTMNTTQLLLEAAKAEDEQRRDNAPAESATAPETEPFFDAIDDGPGAGDVAEESDAPSAEDAGSAEDQSIDATPQSLQANSNEEPVPEAEAPDLEDDPATSDNTADIAVPSIVTASAPSTPPPILATQLDVSLETATQLIENGIDSLAAIANASDEQLLAADGLDERTLARLRSELRPRSGG